MLTPLIFHSLRKLMIAGGALIGLASAFTLSTSAPAEAAKNEACRSRYHSCQARCARKYDEWQFCIYRTCNIQYDNCTGGAPKRKFSAMGPMTPKIPSPIPQQPGKPTKPPHAEPPKHTGTHPSKHECRNGGIGHGPRMVSRGRR